MRQAASISIATVHEALRAAPGTDDASKTAETTTRRRAAVLCPLIERPTGLHVILTRRSMELPTHAGQISFPGGKIDSADASPLAAALRESEEEIGLASPQIEVLGLLDSYDTSTGFLVYPFVGKVDPGFRPTAEPGEVAEVFDVPLDFILDESNHHLREVVRGAERRQFYEMPYEKYQIWGATAGMLRNLCEKIWAIAPS